MAGCTTCARASACFPGVAPPWRPTRRVWKATTCSWSCRERHHARSGAHVHRARVQEGGRARLQRSEEHTSELQSPYDLVCRLLLEKKNKNKYVTLAGSSTRSPKP